MDYIYKNIEKYSPDKKRITPIVKLNLKRQY